MLGASCSDLCDMGQVSLGLEPSGQAHRSFVLLGRASSPSQGAHAQACSPQRLLLLPKTYSVNIPAVKNEKVPSHCRFLHMAGEWHSS